MEKKEKMFQYTYSAAQQEEIKKIREKYIPREENKLEQLRRLDRAAGKKGTAFSLTAGIAGCLLFGLGMACTTVWASSLFLPGGSCLHYLRLSALFPYHKKRARKTGSRNHSSDRGTDEIASDYFISSSLSFKILGSSFFLSFFIIQKYSG